MPLRGSDDEQCRVDVASFTEHLVEHSRHQVVDRDMEGRAESLPVQSARLSGAQLRARWTGEVMLSASKALQ